MICILSDIHSNYSALKSIDEYIKKYPVKKILCAGDIIGYYTKPNETIEWLKKNNAICVLGNHDKALFNNEFLKDFNVYAKNSIIWARQHIKEKNKNFLRKLPPFFQGKIFNKKIYMVHGSPVDNFRDYVYKSSIDEGFLEFLHDIDIDLIILGQTHIPFIKKVNDVLILNPGSVGQPRTGNFQTTFVMYDEKKHEAEIIHLDYDYTDIVQETREELSEYLAQRLIDGK